MDKVKQELDQYVRRGLLTPEEKERLLEFRSVVQYQRESLDSMTQSIEEQPTTRKMLEKKVKELKQEAEKYGWLAEVILYSPEDLCDMQEELQPQASKEYCMCKSCYRVVKCEHSPTDKHVLSLCGWCK